MLIHESDILCQLRQHRWHKDLFNYISTLKQTGCTLYIDSTKQTPQTGPVQKIAPKTLQTSDKMIGLVISVAKS
jgi:hypothetical protein